MINKKEYNIGLDIGTTSVGWSVVEANNQKIMRKGNKQLWGVRLFEEANTASERRNYRSARRRYNRRKERIKLLREIFADEINKVDRNFYQKLEETKFDEKDTINKTILLTDKEKEEITKYKNVYKTIYHLREELINNSEKKDIRLVYLAIHHIIKYRGNFLYQGSDFNLNNLDIEEKLNDLFLLLSRDIPNLEIPEEYEDLIEFKKIEEDLLLESKNDTKVLLQKDLESVTGKNFATEFGKLLTGNSANINKLLMLETDEKINMSFSSIDYDDNCDKYQSILEEKIEILDVLKQIYDAVFLKKIFNGENNLSISSLMINYYNQHGKDLSLIKQVFRNYRKPYNKIFRSSKDKSKMCFYDQYISNKITSDEFKREISKLLDELISSYELTTEQDEILNLKSRINSNDFLPRITTTDNGRFPYQLNEIELIKIIENQGKYYPFLLEKLDSNETYKIVKLLEFKIPYYVGPLVSDEKSKFAWLERKVNDVKITPYNFDEVVDKEKTAEKFIKRMISHCTYLLDEPALTNNSILYSKFKVLNELKQIKVNDRKIELDLQQKIIEELFKKVSGQISERKFKKYLISSHQYDMEKDLRITGYSAENKFANTMQSYIDFFGESGIFENTNYNEEDAEQIIEWITIFEDKDILENKIRNSYKELNENQVQKILSKKYKGWGKLSKKLLTTKYYKDKETELYKSILDLMEETNENFMQIINNDKYNFQKMIQEFNNVKYEDELNYKVVNELVTSPATKRGIYQSLKIVKELVDYIGYEPKNIVIEMSRGDEQKIRKDNKKDYLKKIYDSCKGSIDNYKKLRHELDSHEITNQKLFLYFIQEGKCLYSGEPLNIEDIENQSLYEVDHIIPKTLIKDDSIDNKALVIRKCNQDKSANYVLPKQYRTDYQKAWWKHLKDCKLISAKKSHNLIRDKYSEEEINGFINRQLVETRQITKHVVNILKKYYKNSNVIGLKSSLSHNYRERYELFKFRDINDYHHAHDAYLAAVLGEYKENFMNKKINYDMIKELNKEILNNAKIDNRNLKYGYVINSLDENLTDIALKLSESMSDQNTGELLFDAREFNKKVENTLYRNDILLSKKTEVRTGKFYNDTICKKNVGTIPIKLNMPTETYGGYSGMETKNLILVKYNENDKKIIGIPIVLALRNNSREIDEFIKTQIKLKDNESYTIVKSLIPFGTEIIYKNQNVFISGYAVRAKTCEVFNATQLKLRKSQMIKWKRALQYLLNDVDKYIEDANNNVDDIYAFLVNQDSYPLFATSIDKIKCNIKFEDLDMVQKKKIIKEIFKMYHCNPVNANLSMFNLGERIGRLSGNNITSGIIISKSITGIRESRYEF